MALDHDFLPKIQSGEGIVVNEFDFTEMEDVLVRHHLPYYPKLPTDIVEVCDGNWQSRGRLVDGVRGKGFNGRLIEPIVQLQTAAVESLSTSGKTRRSSSAAPLNPENVVGIQISATIASSNPAIHGNIDKLVWYIRAVRGDTHYRRNVFWTRIIGDNTAENTIEKVLHQTRVVGSQPSKTTPGRTTGHRRVPNR